METQLRALSQWETMGGTKKLNGLPRSIALLKQDPRVIWVKDLSPCYTHSQLGRLSRYKRVQSAAPIWLRISSVPNSLSQNGMLNTQSMLIGHMTTLRSYLSAAGLTVPDMQFYRHL